ncbi:MAG TPA: class I adenylate-forming enzyme family protein [Candidatus Saccharimonadales bacterium]|nr:class I adenylate-forming enzyme family protein [Candidatus Saccharimonadales bacterium]
MVGKGYISDYLRAAADRLDDKEFLVCQDRTLSWSETYAESTSLAAFIAAKLNGRPQTVVGILLPDSWQFVVAYFGIVSAGHIAMPLDITFKKLELDYVTSAVKPDFVIVNRQTQHLINGPKLLIEQILLHQSPKPSFEYDLPPEKQIATLFFSSGTTGRPKPIPNTHQNQIWDVAAIAGPMGWTSRDSLLITLHLAHRHGLVICLLGAVYHGNTVYLEERFRAERALALLQSGKVSLYSSVPAAYAALVEQAPRTKYDLSAVRLFASSSAPLPPYLAEAFKKRFGHAILDRYGTSETGSMAIRTDAAKNSFGELLADVKIRLEPNGEVAMKSPGLFPGYYHNQAATKASLTKDGWWLTGDIGELHAGGLVLRGRSKDKINKAGYSVFPQDIEWALAQHPPVKEVKVIGLPNESNKLNPEDWIAAIFSGSVTERALKDYAKLNLPRSWRPDIFIKVDQIPKTANGKPRLAELKALAEQAK